MFDLYSADDYFNRQDFNPDKKKILAELRTRFRGDEGEERVLIPILDIMTEQGWGAVIHSHKTGYSLLEKTFENVVNKDNQNKSLGEEECKI